MSSRGCIVPFCTSLFRRTKELNVLTFHELPAKEPLRGQWLKKISRADENNSSKPWISQNDRDLVCSLHFKEEDYRTDTKRRILKPNTVPSVFPNYPSYLQKEKKTRKAPKIRTEPILKKRKTMMEAQDLLDFDDQEAHSPISIENRSIITQTQANESSGKIMAHCINCCVPVNKKSKIMGAQILKKIPTSSEPVKETVFVPSVLNYIYKGTGKEITGVGVDGPHGLCPDCWAIVFQLYTFHQKLEALTKFNSLINQTFQLLDSISSVKLEPGTGTVSSTVQTKSSQSNSEKKKTPVVSTKTKSTNTESWQKIPPVDFDIITQKQPNSDIQESELMANESSDHVEAQELKLEPEIEHYDEGDCSDMDIDNESYDSCDPSEDPVTQTPTNSSTSLNTMPPLPQMKSKTYPKHLRYSGPCSEPGCGQTLEYVIKQEIKNHFRQFHGRNIEFLRLCHICEEPLKNRHFDRNLKHFCTHQLDLKTAANNCKNFNEATVRSKCGLALTRDETNAVDESSIKKRHYKKLRERMKRQYQKRISKFKCSICGKPLSSKQSIGKHMKTHMNPEERAVEKARRGQEAAPPPPPRKFLCQECGTCLSSSRSFQDHVSSFHLPQSDRKTYVCTEPNCDFTALLASSVKRHKRRVHTNSTNFKFKCSRCAQGFRIGAELQKHGIFCCDPLERPHACVHCGGRFKFKQNLETHYNDVHELGREVSRELVYPGLQLRPWVAAKQRSKWWSRKKKSKQ